jgi:hypothetical protein
MRDGWVAITTGFLLEAWWQVCRLARNVTPHGRRLVIVPKTFHLTLGCNPRRVKYAKIIKCIKRYIARGLYPTGTRR